MFCLEPMYKSNYQIGDVGFTARPGTFLHNNIALETDRASQEAGRLVPSHALLITGPNQMVEATWPNVHETELAPLIEDPEALLWVCRPLGQTEAAINESVRLARDIAKDKAPYDWQAHLGFLASDQDGADGKPNSFQRDKAWFCSELVFFVLKATARLRAVQWPEKVATWPKGFVSPDRLYDFPIWDSLRLKASGRLGRSRSP